MHYPRQKSETWSGFDDPVGGVWCHAEWVPCVASMRVFLQAAAGFVVADPGLVIESAALAAARRSLDGPGLLLVGEVHGVAENPLVIRALMRAFGLTSLALEWPEELAPVVAAFLATGTLAGHRLLWRGRPDHRRAPGGAGRTRRSRAAECDHVRRDDRPGLELVAV